VATEFDSAPPPLRFITGPPISPSFHSLSVLGPTPRLPPPPLLHLSSSSRPNGTFSPSFVFPAPAALPCSPDPVDLDLRARFILTDRPTCPLHSDRPTPSTCGPPTDAFYVWTPDRRRCQSHSALNPTLLLPFRLPCGSDLRASDPPEVSTQVPGPYPTYATTTFPSHSTKRPRSAPSGLPRGPRPTNSARNPPPSPQRPPRTAARLHQLH
jgi:hypothetical protein